MKTNGDEQEVIKRCSHVILTIDEIENLPENEGLFHGEWPHPLLVKIVREVRELLYFATTVNCEFSWVESHMHSKGKAIRAFISVDSEYRCEGVIYTERGVIRF